MVSLSIMVVGWHFKVLVKLGTSAMVGQLALGFAMTAPIFMFSNSKLQTVPDTDARREYTFADYFGLRLFMSSLAMLAIVVVTFLAGYRFETGLIICVVATAKAIQSASDIFYRLLQQHLRMDRIAISLMIKGPLSLMVFVVAVVSTGSLAWRVVFLLKAWIMVLFIWDLPNGVWIMRRSAGKDGILPRLSLAQTASTWAEAVLMFKNSSRAINKSTTLEVVVQSPFSIDIGVKELERVYAGK